MEDVGGIARSPSIHDVECVLIHTARHDGGHGGSCLDDGMQPVLAVAHVPLGIEFDGFTREPPFTALDRRGQRIDAALRRTEPFARTLCLHTSLTSARALRLRRSHWQQRPRLRQIERVHTV
jgi:hypothetical protein